MEKQRKTLPSPAQQSLAGTIQETRKEAASLLDLRIRGLISDDDFALKKQELTERELRVKERLLHEETAPKRRFEPAAKTFLFANQAPKLFPAASNAEKREILLSLGSNLELKDGILRMTAQKPFLLMESGRRVGLWQAVLRRLRTWFIRMRPANRIYSPS